MPILILIIVLIGVVVFFLWWQRRPARSLESGWLDHETFEKKIALLERRLLKAGDAQWAERRMWILSTQANAAMMAQQAPRLQPELEALMISVLKLAQHLLESSATLPADTDHDSPSLPTMHLASLRLQNTYAQVQTLRDQLILPPDTSLIPLPNTTLSESLRRIIQDNQMMIP